MNQRIKELAEQAGFDSELMELNHNNGTPSIAETFAELIVRECANTAKNCFVYWPMDGSLQRTGCANAIKHHFGVEE